MTFLPFVYRARVTSLILVAFLAQIAFSSSLWGALLPINLDKLTKKSKVVVCGEVVGMDSYWTDIPKLGRVIVTEVRVRVSEIWKGSLGVNKNSGNEITVKLFGGKVGDEWQMCLESPKYDIGEKVLVFARNWQGEGLWTTGWLQGKFKLLETKSGIQVEGKKHLPITKIERLEAMRDKVRSLVALHNTGSSARISVEDPRDSGPVKDLNGKDLNGSNGGGKSSEVKKK